MKYHIDPSKLFIHGKLVKRVECDEDSGAYIILYSVNDKRPRFPDFMEPTYIEYINSVLVYASWIDANGLLDVVRREHDGRYIKLVDNILTT